MLGDSVTTNDARDAWDDLRLCDRLAALARQGLIAAAELTPKPGLVDRRGPGEDDLSLDLVRQSATVLEPYFSLMADVSAGQTLNAAVREELGLIGRDAERATYNASSDSSTHKGAIWILGLLVAAAARLHRTNADLSNAERSDAKEIAAMAGSIARLADRAQPALVTHGEITKWSYGAKGARGEASDDFPRVIEFGLPTLRRQRAAGSAEEVSRIDALLSIMSQLDDTGILYQGGLEALNAVKSGAQAVLAAGGYGAAAGRKLMDKLDQEVIARHVSPGGSGVLLAATIFLDAVERRQCEIHKDQSEAKSGDGLV